MRISESAANDWEPSLAAADDGTIWVGWDTYDKGDYDVMVRPIRNGATRTDSPDYPFHALRSPRVARLR